MFNPVLDNVGMTRPRKQAWSDGAEDCDTVTLHQRII